jgi:hypothetical protein
LDDSLSKNYDFRVVAQYSSYLIQTAHLKKAKCLLETALQKLEKSEDK